MAERVHFSHTEFLSGSENVVAACGDALAAHTLVEGICAARGPVRHGGGEEVVGRGVFHSAEQLALVLAAY